MSEYDIRALCGLAELEACSRLQEEIWGAGFSERVPVAILEVARRIGGVVAGAWDDDGTLIGFVFGLTGLEDGRPVHWSDMLAVRRGRRNRGLGRALKLHQRSMLLSAGVTKAYWTFDPLESKNAHVNLTRLGAVVREYVRDMYGTTDSPLHRGIGTDRFVATWELDSARVVERCEGPPLPASREAEALPSAIGVGGTDAVPEPGEVRPEVLLEARFAVPIPADVQSLKAAAPDVARRWRDATRSVLEIALDGRREVTELRREGSVSYYVVESRPDRSRESSESDGRTT